MNQPDPSQRAAALEWFVKLRDSEVGAAERETFAAWRAADPRHAAAYDEAERLWAALDQVEPPGAAPAPGRARPPQPMGPRPVASRPLARRPLRRLVQAAAIAAVAVLTGYLLAGPQPVDSLLADYSTTVGGREGYRLADRSTVELNGATALSVDFTAAARRVTLHGGEAYFEVARDPQRPFVVETPLGTVTVLGTAFTVKTGAGFVDVTVTESRVAVTHKSGGRQELLAGQALRLGPARLGEVTPGEPEQALAWRSGKLVFRNTPLSEVIAALERQRRGRIELMDGALRDLKVTGAFNLAAEPRGGDKVLDAIAASFPVRLVRVTDYLVLVFPRQRG